MQDAKTLGAMLGAALTAQAVRSAGPRTVAREAAVGIVSLAPSLLALRGGELAAYHGVEHKAIASYEHDDPDAADAAKEHERCGSHLIAPVLAANGAGAAVRRKVAEPARPAAAGGGGAGA